MCDRPPTDARIFSRDLENVDLLGPTTRVALGRGARGCYSAAPKPGVVKPCCPHAVLLATGTAFDVLEVPPFE
jgi:hypothetical protein